MTLSLAIGLGMYGLTLAVQMLLVVTMIHIASGIHSRSLLRASYGRNFILLQLVAAQMLLVHLVNIALWAGLFWLCGEFEGFEAAFYHSAVNYSSLGYGDIVMSMRWRLLGPLEAVDGIVMFGISTALIVALMTRLIEQRMKATQSGMDGTLVKQAQPAAPEQNRLTPAAQGGCFLQGTSRGSHFFRYHSEGAEAQPRCGYPPSISLGVFAGHA
jgi:hypothetical protein